MKGTVHSDKELIKKLPDSGPLSISDYEVFKKSSKVIFNEKWIVSRSCVKNTASLSDYFKLQLLGAGGFGCVVLVKHRLTNNLYALKCIDKEEVIKNHQLENLRTEQLILHCINFPFTIYSLNTFKDNCYIYFVLPFIEGGDLYEHLNDIGEGNEDRARFYASQVILALEYLHYLDLIYRDLKPENILIDHTGYVKLSDFGFAKRMKRRLRTYTLCGTPEYIAPEVVLNKGYGKSVDWGCLIYEFVAGYTPFVSSEVGKIYEKITSRRYRCPKTFSPDLKELIDRLLQTDLSRRYGNLKNGVADIKEHKWFDSINWLAILNRMVEAPYKPKHPLLNLNRTWKLPKEGKENKYSHEFSDF